jgi:hypothetical protein
MVAHAWDRAMRHSRIDNCRGVRLEYQKTIARGILRASAGFSRAFASWKLSVNETCDQSCRGIAQVIRGEPILLIG